MKYDPSQDNLPEPNIPHLRLEDLMIESILLDDHGNFVIGERNSTPKEKSITVTEE